MIISIDLKPILSTQETFLGAPFVSTSTNLKVINNGGFVAGDYAIIGQLGSERSEIVGVNSVSGNDTVVTSALKFSHESNTQFKKVFYNQLIIEKSTDGGIVWATDTTVTINGDQEYYDYSVNGNTTDLFRTRFYNSTSGTYSQYSNILSTTGTPIEIIINSIFSKLKIDEKGDNQITPEDVFNLIAEVDLEICRTILLSNPNYFTSSVSIDLLPNTFEYDLPLDFVRSSRVLVKYSDDASYQISSLIDADYGDQITDTATKNVHYIINNNGRYKIGIKTNITNPVIGGLKIDYNKVIQRVYQTSDSLNLPNSPLFIDVLENRVMQKILFYYKQEYALADRHEVFFKDGVRQILQIIGMSDWTPNVVMNNNFDDIYYPYS